MADPQVQSKPRTLVLCFDGTSNEYDADNTNVVKFFALLKKDDDQLCYYQAGVGTYFEPGVVSPLFTWCAQVLDLAFAWYLNQHVMDGYTFLMQNYRPGDKICIFGFSRGAYTARALGGFLYKVGLLPKDNQAQIPFAFDMYKRTDAAGLILSAGFKQTYCQEVSIEFMGVWETVSSIGVIMARTLPFTNSNVSIKTFRHALSLDEHRAKFRPNRYHRPAPSAQAARLDPEHASPVLQADANEKSNSSSTKSSDSDEEVDVYVRAKSKRIFKRGEKVKIKIKRGTNAIEIGQCDDVLEVWFAGCHSDVGGGAVTNDTPQSLANISLCWMVHQVVASDCGILWDLDAAQRANIELTPAPSTAEVDSFMIDALQPLHDELKINPFWWILEVIPLQFAWQDAEGVWHREWGVHLGRGRKITDAQPNFHVSVQKRIASLKYTPKAKWKVSTEVYLQ